MNREKLIKYVFALAAFTAFSSSFNQRGEGYSQEALNKINQKTFGQAYKAGTSTELNQETKKIIEQATLNKNISDAERFLTEAELLIENGQSAIEPLDDSRKYLNDAGEFGTSHEYKKRLITAQKKLAIWLFNNAKNEKNDGFCIIPTLLEAARFAKSSGGLQQLGISEKEWEAVAGIPFDTLTQHSHPENLLLAGEQRQSYEPAVPPARVQAAPLPALQRP